MASVPANQLSPDRSLLRVAANRSGPPACDSTFSRKATFRRRPSFTTKSASRSRRVITRLATACPAHASWRCRPACIATRSARSTANWKRMAWWKPWLAPASMCVTSKNPVKSATRCTSATVASPTSIAKCANASMAYSTPAAHCNKPGNCSHEKLTGGCAAEPACWSAPPGKTSAPRC